MSTVMLVADASWVANEVKAALSLGEWEISEVADPREVTELAKDQRPDALVIDMQVGSMGGMAVIRGVRSEFHDDDRPRLILLLDRSVDRFLAKRAGADASVLKPITAAVLREALLPLTGEAPSQRLEQVSTKPRRRRTAPSTLAAGPASEEE